MSSFLTRLKLRWGLAIALGVSAFTLALQWSGSLDRFEWITYDYRMQVFRAETPLHPEVAVILIDEASLQALDPLVGRWPWPRSLYGDLIDFLAMGGARAVVFDVLFTEHEQPPRNGQLHASDARLVQASADTDIVVSATQIRREQDDEVDTAALNQSLPADFLDRFALPQAVGFPERGNNSYALPIPDLYRASHGIGVVDMDSDRDSVYRRVNLFFRYQEAVFPALSLAPLVDELGRERLVQDTDTLHLDDVRVPLDRDGRYLVNMVGKLRPYSIGGIFASIQHLQAGEVDQMLVYPDEFAGKVVFVGASAIGLSDIKTTPLSSKTPGVAIHASVVSNILSGDFLRPVPQGFTVGATLLVAFLTVFGVLGTTRLTIQLLLPAVVAAGFGAAAFLAFRHGWVLDMAAPITATTLGVINAAGYLAFTEGRDKRRVRKMLGQYVSPAVLAEVVDRYQDQLKAEVGTREHLTILFSDVRGFTSISEQLQAEQVVDLLNIHFSVMSEVIFRYQGTLDKFIGDAIMAFWGAPIRLPDHARRAVCAAIEMWRAIEQVNTQLTAKGYPAIDIGIGLNTGDMVLGNIGSERKLDYTVIGDHVNLGSRLEGLTKQYGCHVIISEFTYAELRGEVPCAVVDMVRVKGKQVPIRIYWPLAHPDDDPARMEQARTVAELSEQAFAAYLRRDWDQAESLYRELPNHHLGEVFEARCTAFRAAPPPPEWDGVYTLTSK